MQLNLPLLPGIQIQDFRLGVSRVTAPMAPRHLGRAIAASPWCSGGATGATTAPGFPLYPSRKTSHTVGWNASAE
ncbi:MAG: hypothetical protein MUF42_01930 [Cytophagaceae bacterium]|nr:hypothetical protein [Cytophagaceae bacterium]